MFKVRTIFSRQGNNMQKINKFQDNFNVTGFAIKRIRKQQKITQEDSCARMQVMGYQISRSDISKIENGKKFIADFEVFGFAKALKVSLLDLYSDFLTPKL